MIKFINLCSNTHIRNHLGIPRFREECDALRTVIAAPMIGCSRDEIVIHSPQRKFLTVSRVSLEPQLLLIYISVSFCLDCTHFMLLNITISELKEVQKCVRWVIFMGQ